MSIRYMLALTFIILGILLNLKLQDAMAEGDGPDWELRQLHDPSPALLAREHRGQVTLYEGLPVEEVDRALDEQFERIDKLIFIRTQRPTEDGTLVFDSD